MASSLHDILQWAKENGEVKTLDRIRMKVLPVTSKEKINLEQVGPDTTCSDKCLDAVRKAATEIVGKDCPY